MPSNFPLAPRMGSMRFREGKSDLRGELDARCARS
jgi:hypothetical protein